MIRLFHKKQNILITLLAMLCILLGTVFCAVKSPYAQAQSQTASVQKNGSRIVASVGNSYTWLRADESNGEYAVINGKQTQYYDITADDVGKYIKATVDGVESETIGPIGNLYVFDLAKSSVSFASTVTGKDASSASISVAHNANNIYVVQQSNNQTATKNGISFSGSSITYDVTLDGINVYETFTSVGPDSGPQVSNYSSCIHIPASTTMKVVLRVKGENSVRGIHYYTGASTMNYSSSLKITDINGDGETSGYLYIPKKVAAKDIDAFMESKLNHNHWNAGIGGDDGNALVSGLTLAGANVQVLTTYGDNCTAIGGGGNGAAIVNITGGNVYAACNGTGAAIGGGIGWNSGGGEATVNISGGKVYAKNYSELTYKGYKVGGVAIGGGSSFHKSGSQSTVNISGGFVEAYGTFGNGIGGGNSSTLTGGQAEVTISGGKVTASSIGGGNSQSGTAGNATVSVSGTADIVLTGGIGGGDSASGNGGKATIIVKGGNMRCGATIGGGNGGGNGVGGDAIIQITGGSLTSKAIGGGNGAGTGRGGGANVTVQDGKLTATTIGGGKGGANGALGNATANISGGEIKGQFVMAQGANPCVFTMSGGILYGVDTSSAEYEHKNGGAVYIEDSNGKVYISGGTIQGGVAENGGAIYLGGGDVYIYGGNIIDNTAKQNGGGVYVGNGNFYMEGGSLSGNVAVNGAGGGAYVQGSDHIRVSVRSGVIENNQAALRGGAIAVIGSATTNDLVITIGIKAKHYDENGDVLDCDHKEYSGQTQLQCPVIRNNKATAENSEGGAFYITGNYETQFNTYCLVESGNTADGGQSKSDFMKVDGGRIVISTAQDDTEEESTGGYGNVVVEGTIYVKAGQMQLKGTNPAPRLLGAITVDITPGGDDFFEDVRDFEREYHTVQYFEDFQQSGQYTIHQIPHNSLYTIAAAMYGHSGYEFDGWATKDKNGNYVTVYEVGGTYTLTESLILYAKWNVNVYFVEYNANVPPETSYQGTMAQSQFVYDKHYTLALNAYQRKGYQFQGWAITQDGDVVYADGATVFNLAESAGYTITLYAVWAECMHTTILYAQDDNVITRWCNCLAFEETVTIVGEDATYDGASHAAQLVYSGDKWTQDAITYMYKKSAADEYETVNEVVNAGFYTASFTYNGYTAVLSFRIYKATQAAPSKPTYNDYEYNQYRYIQVQPTGEKESWQVYEYRIGYLSNGEIVYVYNQDRQSPTFVLDKSLTNYFVYICFAETDNYYASSYKQADGVYFFAGDITLTVSYGEGLDGLAHYATEGGNSDGITIVCALDEGYYRLDTFNVTIRNDTSGLAVPEYRVEGLNQLTVRLHDIPNGSNLKVHIEGAKRIVTVQSAATSGETFGKVMGTTALIGNDSTYTAYFNVQYFERYAALQLSFNKALPKDTTILLIDKTTETYTYWYYRVQTSSSLITIASNFINMETGAPFAVSGTAFAYQFVVDFSLCDKASLLTGVLSTKLSASPSASDVPSIPEHAVYTTLEPLIFAVEETTATNNSTADLTVSYAKTQENTVVSQWENRGVALVLTTSDSIPMDTAVEVAEETQTTVFYQAVGGQFILPLNVDGNSIGDVRLTLKSDLFPITGATYVFNGVLYAANAMVGKAPLNGEILDTFTVTFIIEGAEEVALKIDAEKRVYSVNGTLIAQITGTVSNRYELTADVMNKQIETGKYVSTGLRPQVTVNSTLQIAFEGLNLEKGSYCLMVSVKSKTTGLVVLRVPYYFILY